MVILLWFCTDKIFSIFVFFVLLYNLRFLSLKKWNISTSAPNSNNRKTTTIRLKWPYMSSLSYKEIVIYFCSILLEIIPKIKIKKPYKFHLVKLKKKFYISSLNQQIRTVMSRTHWMLKPLTWKRLSNNNKSQP